MGSTRNCAEALASDGVFRLHWLGKINVWMLGATYSDLDRRRYTTVSQHDGNIIVRGHRLQHYVRVNFDYSSGRNSHRYWEAPDLRERQDLVTPKELGIKD